MDADDVELMVRLCTKAGMIMEDANVLALDTSGFTADHRAATIARLTAASHLIRSLLLAADALTRGEH